MRCGCGIGYDVCNRCDGGAASLVVAWKTRGGIAAAGRTLTRDLVKQLPKEPRGTGGSVVESRGVGYSSDVSTSTGVC